MSILSALQGVFTILILIVVGVVITKMGLLDQNMQEKLTKIVLWFSVPFQLFENSSGTFTLPFIREYGLFILLPYVIMFGSIAVGFLCTRIFRIQEHRRGLFVTMFSLSNNIFVGLPVCTAIFGDAGISFVCMYLFCNTTTFWTFGISQIAKDAGQKFKFGPRTLMQIFSPPLCGFLAGVVVAILGIQLPEIIVVPMRYLGSLTIPLAMILAGAIIAGMGRRAFRLDRAGIGILVGRILVAPVLALVLCKLFVLPLTMTGVFVVESAMPVMTQAMIMARFYKADYELSAQMICVTTMASLVMVPILVLVMNAFFV